MRAIAPDSNLAALSADLRQNVLDGHGATELSRAELLFLRLLQRRLVAIDRGIANRSLAGNIQAQALLAHVDWTELGRERTGDSAVFGRVMQTVSDLADKRIGQYDWTNPFQISCAWLLLAEVDPMHSQVADGILELYSRTNAVLRQVSEQPSASGGVALGQTCWDYTGEVLRGNQQGLETALAQVLNSLPPFVNARDQAAGCMFIQSDRGLSVFDPASAASVDYRAAV